MLSGILTLGLRMGVGWVALVPWVVLWVEL